MKGISAALVRITYTSDGELLFPLGLVQTEPSELSLVLTRDGELHTPIIHSRTDRALRSVALE